MKKRPAGFLSKEYLDSDSEVGDYIRELHTYLWEFIHAAMPNVGGHLSSYVDKALELARQQSQYYHIRYPLEP